MDKVRAAIAVADEAAAEQDAAQEVADTKAAAEEACAEAVRAAKIQAAVAEDAVKQWERDNPIEAATLAGVAVGGAVGAVAVDALRPRKLTDTAKDAVLEGLFGAFGLDAEKEKVREQAAREEKLYRIKLFEPDLKLLGLSLLDAPDLDEKRLRKAFRERSRVLHPDVRDESLDQKGVPTVYELNAAFEALRKLL
ncbi:hypothetical protein Ctob_006927 [Chrysochromulina tobinii]|uniref:J domain-containing protein n=1 Tax=Chrysochromulina tobinii TaxID=1460289 RepID=A0A0M0JYP4_9EUKA|nr:hypothetical protein Ctob_006927 [Chrysochromulina tobinii]|eukprot:KOO31689.1 hypothetical protein Ctob_006927 [Chrysochromulina sp. CCMP291]